MRKADDPSLLSDFADHRARMDQLIARGRGFGGGAGFAQCPNPFCAGIPQMHLCIRFVSAPRSIASQIR